MRMMKALIAILVPILAALAEEPAGNEWRRYIHYQFHKPGDSLDVSQHVIMVSGDLRASYRSGHGILSHGVFHRDPPPGGPPAYGGRATRKQDTLTFELHPGKSRLPRPPANPIKDWKLLATDTALVEAIGGRTFLRDPIPFPEQVQMDMIRFATCKQSCFEPGTQLLIDLIADPGAFREGVTPVIGKYYDWRDWLRTVGPSLDRAQVARFRDLKAQARVAIDSLPDPKGFWARLKHDLKAPFQPSP